jgi:predicted Rossmann fold flavoprotein
MYDICIIGGGPAGMSAAITAKNLNPQLRVCIIEKNPILGKKLFATGNGKCNLSHQSCQESLEVLKLFDSIGIFTRTDETGRMYPASEQAADVVSALQNALRIANVELKCNAVPKKISRDETCFEIELSNEIVKCRKLLLATGGKAGPQYGNLGEGYNYSKELGHHVNRTYPVLSPLECTENFQLLKGIRAKGNVTLLFNGEPIATESGEIQFTDDGLSGICVFNLSRFVRLNPNIPQVDAIKAYTVAVDFIPSLSLKEVERCIKNRVANPNLKIEDLLLTMVHPSVSNDMINRVGFDTGKSAEKLSDADIQQLAVFLKDWTCHVSGVKGWKKAQCTGGGIPLSEIDTFRGESLFIKDLYFAGELLDYDGPSGGFNLHFAWASGIKAGKAMANEKV